MSLRLAFMGTPAFAVPVLDALIAAKHEIAAVYTQPPRPAGRGHKLRPSPAQERAEAAGLAVRHPPNFKDRATLDAFAALGLDAAVVVAYGLILPKAVLDVPRHGCFNVHASLLPRWRGAAPIHRAILAGEAETGVAVMRMDPGLDTGPVALMRRVAIGPRETTGTLHDTLAQAGATLMVEALALLEAGTLGLQAQPADGATYARKIEPNEERIDWTRSAGDIDRQVRALSPFPGAYCELGGERVKVFAAEPVEGRVGAPPGTLLDDRLAVACGAGALRLMRLQRPGKAAMDASDFLRGRPVAPGTHAA